MGTLTDIRMACHQLAEPEFGHPADLVGWMGAMQAQDYTMSKWAVGLRLKSATIAQVNEALAKGEIVRTHIMRPTWHYVAGKDLRWMLQLTSSRLKKVIDSWVKASGLDISENQYTQCNDLIGKMLSGGNCLTREEIEMELGHAGVPVTGDRVRRYVLRAEMEGIVCSGADKNGNIKRLNNYNIRFSIEGEGRLLGGPGVLANPAPVKWGTAPVLVQSTLKPGKIRITASVLFEGSQMPVSGELEFESKPSAFPLVYDASDAARIPLGSVSTGQNVASKTDAEREVERLRKELNTLKLKEVERQQSEFGEKEQ